MIRRHGWPWHARVIPFLVQIPARPRGRQLLASSMVLDLRRNGAADWALGHHALEQVVSQDHQTSSIPRLGLSMQARFDCFDRPSYYWNYGTPNVDIAPVWGPLERAKWEQEEDPSSPGSWRCGASTSCGLAEMSDRRATVREDIISSSSKIRMRSQGACIQRDLDRSFHGCCKCYCTLLYRVIRARRRLCQILAGIVMTRLKIRYVRARRPHSQYREQ